MRTLKEGMVIVLDEDIFSENQVVLLDSKDDIVVGWHYAKQELVTLSRQEIITKVTKQQWWNKTPKTL